MFWKIGHCHGHSCVVGDLRVRCGRRRGHHAKVRGGRHAQSLAGAAPPASATSATESMVGTKVGILHKVQFIYRVDYCPGAQVERLVRRVVGMLVGVMLHLKVLQTHGVGGALVELVEVAAVQRDV